MAISIFMKLNSQWQFQWQFSLHQFSMAISISMFWRAQYQWQFLKNPLSMAMSMAIIFYPPFQWQCQYQFLYPAKSMAISMSIFLKSNFNVNVNTNCFSSKISMSMAMSMLEIHLNQCQFFVNQWPFRLINFNGNVNFSKIPFSIPMAISIFLGSPSQLSMAISMPPKRSMSMARQYYCSCLIEI